MALDLTASGNDTVGAGHVAKFDNLSALTVSGWLNLRGTPGEGDVVAINAPRPSAADGEGGWELRITSPNATAPCSPPGTSPWSSWLTGAGRRIERLGEASAPLNADGRWVFFAATDDAQGLVTLYTGDAARALAQSGGQTAVPWPLGANTVPFEVGGMTVDNPFDPTPPAWLDDLRVYGSAPSVVQLDQVRTQAVSQGVLLNDSDPNGDRLSAVLATGPTHGSLTFNADGSFAYTPAPNYLGKDSFTYRASDGALSSGLATVTLDVTGPDDPPVAVNDSYSVSQDGTLAPAVGVLGNDTDANGQALTAVLLTQPTHGALSFNASGRLSTRPTRATAGPTDSPTRRTTGRSTATPPPWRSPSIPRSARSPAPSGTTSTATASSTVPSSPGSPAGRSSSTRTGTARLDAGETSTTTGIDGTYRFNNLPYGTYTVAQVLPAGWGQTSPAGSAAVGQSVTVGGSQSIVFDFNDQATTATRTIGAYRKSGFTFDTNVVGTSTKFDVFGSTDTNYHAGSPALASQWAPATITMKSPTRSRASRARSSRSARSTSRRSSGDPTGRPSPSPGRRPPAGRSRSRSPSTGSSGSRPSTSRGSTT